jgi:hypothetical protein
VYYDCSRRCACKLSEFQKLISCKNSQENSTSVLESIKQVYTYSKICRQKGRTSPTVLMMVWLPCE